MILIKSDINDKCSSVLAVCSNYKNRLNELNVKFKNINVYILGNYDLIIAKLSRGNLKDFDDVASIHRKEIIDFTYLRNLVTSEYCGIGENKLLSNINALETQINEQNDL